MTLWCVGTWSTRKARSSKVAYPTCRRKKSPEFPGFLLVTPGIALQRLRRGSGRLNTVTLQPVSKILQRLYAGRLGLLTPLLQGH